MSVLSVIDVQAFERLLGPCMDIMKRNIANYEEQLVALFGSSTEIEQQSAWTAMDHELVDEKEGCYDVSPIIT